MPPDDGFMPAFDSGPDDLRFNDAPAAKPAPRVDARPLPPAVPLDAIGVSGDWPTLAVDLPLKGIAYQLAFNSELTACDGMSITLPLYGRNVNHTGRFKFDPERHTMSAYRMGGTVTAAPSR